MNHLNGLLAFVKTAELGSFVAAGQVLELSASAVGKAVSKLEMELGVRLLQRSTRSISLTDEGRLFHARCRRILDDLDEARGLLSQTLAAPRGRLRLSAPVVTHHLLVPLLPPFRERYPDIEVDIDFNDRMVDLVDAGIDLAIRSGVLADSNLVTRPLRPYWNLICAAPGYLARHGTPQHAAEFAQHTGVCFRFPNSGKLRPWPIGETSTSKTTQTTTPTSAQAIAEPPGEALPDFAHVLSFNNMEAVFRATLSGLGIGCIPDFLVQPAIASGELIVLLNSDAGPAAGRFHAVWPSSRYLSPKVRVFIDHLGEWLSGERAVPGSPRP